MSVWRFTIALLIAVALQTSFFPRFDALRTKPDCLLILAAHLGLAGQPFGAAVGGVAAGFMRDLAGSGKFGLGAFMFCVMALFLNRFCSHLSTSWLPIRAGIVFCAAGIFGFVEIITVRTDQSDISLLFLIGCAIFQAVCTSLLSFAVLPILNRFKVQGQRYDF
ncbi:MAG TPA: hypothetical protein PL033_18580 [Candidatus Brocadiia bacterium]|nr:hypothetical protein [Candidatus Brocadiia bacterium]